MEFTTRFTPQEPLHEGVRPAVPKEVLELVDPHDRPHDSPFGRRILGNVGHNNGLWSVSWPAFNPELAKEEEVEIVVQVNGRVRGKVKVPAGAAQQDVLILAQSEAGVTAHLDGKKIVKVIYVPDKLLNIVAA